MLTSLDSQVSMEPRPRRKRRDSLQSIHHYASLYFYNPMLLLIGLIVRLAFLAWGLWQDAHLAVKWTDIDYEVFTDAAQFVHRGGSPYDRSTYRYSPLLAYLMLPNVMMHKAAGKLIFCAADLLAARLFQALLARNKRVPARLRRACTALWLLNPLTVTISTRGSGEAVVACLLLALLLALSQGVPLQAGTLFGLAVHYRVYPIIYALPILLHLGASSHVDQRRLAPGSIYNGAAAVAATPAAQAGEVETGGSPAMTLQHKLRSLFSKQGIVFGLSAASVFLGLGALFYRLYGWPFLHETYLYHITRSDPRHNFSPFFYPAYLASGMDPGAAPSVGWAFTLAQAMLQLSLGWNLAGDLPFCLLLQTVVLVAFNRVCTAQYFVWYLTFLPLVLPQLLAARNKGRLAASVAAWVAAMAHWLLWAYLLEFKGLPLHHAVWAASLVFLAANVWVIYELVSSKARRQAGLGQKLKPQ